MDPDLVTVDLVPGPPMVGVRYPCVSTTWGPVINYGEGGFKMAKLQVKNFLHPLSRHGKKEIAPPPPASLLKGENVLRPPPSVWLKLKAPVLKLPQNFWCPPIVCSPLPPSPLLMTASGMFSNLCVNHTKMWFLLNRFSLL